MFEEKIRQKIEEYPRQIVDTLSELVAIPTENPPGRSYKQCVDYLSRKLKEWKIGHRIIAVPDGQYPRVSILGECGKGEDCLHFHGHYDVVPADSAAQFKPLLKRGRIYGRGSSDMKSGLMAMLFAIRAVKECGVNLKSKFTFSLVPDEETGGLLGTRYLFESGLLPRPSSGTLMPEPTSGAIWNANKGALTYRVEIKGKYSHVALEHEGVNAFEQMVGVVRSLLRLKKDVRKRKTEMTVNPPDANRSVMLIGGESGSGVNFNVVPEKAFFTIDRRINPEEKLDDAKVEILHILEEHRRKGVEIEVKLLQEGDSSVADSKAPLASTLEESIEEETGKKPVFELCPGLCEIRFFNRRRIPAYAYGPGLLQVSHGPEESVRISDIISCTRIYALTALRLMI